MMMFGFHYFLTGIPKQKSIYQAWHYGFMLAGLFIAFFSFSVLFTTDASRFDLLTDWFFMKLFWSYLLTALVLALFFSVSYQFYKWQRQVGWRKERYRIGYVYYSFFLVALLDMMSMILFPETGFIMYLKVPHIFLLPWFLTIAFGLVGYRFSPPDPAKAAKEVLTDLRQVLLFCDQKARLKETNQFSLDLLRTDKAQISNMHITSLFSDAEKVRQMIQTARTNEHAGPEKLELVSASGIHVPVIISCTVLKDRFDDFYGIAFYGSDHTEYMELKREIETSEEMEESLRLLTENLENEINDRTAEIRQSLEDAEQKINERVQNEQKIKQEIEEMEVMMNEIHTRITKNITIILTMLNTISSKTSDPADIMQINTLYRRINSILLVNTQVKSHENYGMVDFKHYLELLLNCYSKEYDDVPKITLSATNELIWVDQAVPLSIVANEIMNAALTYLFENKINSTCQVSVKYAFSDHANYILEFSISSLETDDIFSDSFFGFDQIELAAMLVREQLGGSIVISSNKAFSVLIQIPIPELRQGHLGIAR